MNITDVLTQPVDTKLVIDWGDGTTTADSYYGPAGSGRPGTRTPSSGPTGSP
ncbi:hypothetical protein ACFQ0T_16905 [Kitasatospora gansuensis]